MRKAWYWILVVLAGSLPVGSALQYYFGGEVERNTSTRNWLVVGQVVLGLLIIAFGLYMQFRAGRQDPPAEDGETKLNLD